MAQVTVSVWPSKAYEVEQKNTRLITMTVLLEGLQKVLDVLGVKGACAGSSSVCHVFLLYRLYMPQPARGTEKSGGLWRL